MANEKSSSLLRGAASVSQIVLAAAVASGCFGGSNSAAPSGTAGSGAKAGASGSGGTSAGGSSQVAVDGGVAAKHGTDGGGGGTGGSSGSGGASGVDGGGNCPSTNVCTADYPCQQLTDGYTCRGQFADWTPTDSPSTFTADGLTVTDSRNGLAWQQTVSNATYNWSGAKDYCTRLPLVADEGWRLPTIAELESIVDYTADAKSSILDPVFLGSNGSGLWSSSPYVGTSDEAWSVSGISGSSYKGCISGLCHVRCVRSSALVVAGAGSGGAPPGRYTYPASGTVYDTRTKLSWQQAVDANTYTQAQALTYCTGLSLAGGGWRLPKVSELLTIADRTQSNPAIDATAFPRTPATYFWSSSPSVFDASETWVVHFYSGDSTTMDATYTYRVRCVR